MANAKTVGRDFQIYGEALISVRGNGNLGSGGGSIKWELGLAEGPITITPAYHHNPVNTEDFADVPVDMQWMLDEVSIRTRLIHYDPLVLSWTLAESRGGIWTNHTAPQIVNGVPTLLPGLGNTKEGAYVGAGSLLGKGLPLLASGNNFVRLYVESATQVMPWRFLSVYVPTPPLEIPLGTEKTGLEIEWRAIPYCPIYQSGGSMTSGGVILNVDGTPGIYSPAQEARSSGTILWDRWQT